MADMQDNILLEHSKGIFWMHALLMQLAQLTDNKQLLKGMHHAVCTSSSKLKPHTVFHSHDRWHVPQVMTLAASQTPLLGSKR